MENDPLAKFANSPFRSRFKLSLQDKAYIQQKGLDTIRLHAQDFIKTRLAPAFIPNDGKQTPMRHHPVFCCTTCDGNLLSRMFSKMAPYSRRTTTH